MSSRTVLSLPSALPAPFSATGTFSTTATFSTAEISRIRNDFPILDRAGSGQPLVYLDSGATSQKPLSVLEAEQEFYEQRNAAVHRGAHQLAVAATDAFEAARATVAAFVGVGAEELVWTQNATAGLNLLAYSFSNASTGDPGTAASRFALSPGDEILVTEMEHHANLVPWQELCRRTGATLRYIPVDDGGGLRLEAAGELFTARTRIVAFTHASNVLGTINPVANPGGPGPPVRRAGGAGRLPVRAPSAA